MGLVLASVLVEVTHVDLDWRYRLQVSSLLTGPAVLRLRWGSPLDRLNTVGR